MQLGRLFNKRRGGASTGSTKAGSLLPESTATQWQNLVKEVQANKFKSDRTELIASIHAEMQLESENHSSGMQGLSFCPFHRVRPSQPVRRSSSQQSFRKKDGKFYKSFQPQPLRSTTAHSTSLKINNNMLAGVSFNEQTSRQ